MTRSAQGELSLQDIPFRRMEVIDSVLAGVAHPTNSVLYDTMD